jgi:MerR family transcriptional regulator, light-induced transcriptional regulator
MPDDDPRVLAQDQVTAPPVDLACAQGGPDTVEDVAWQRPALGHHVDALAVEVAARLNTVDFGFERSEARFSVNFVRAFAALLLEDRYDVAERLLLRLCAGRKSYIEIADSLLAGVARSAGERWEADEVSFADVTLVVGNLLRLRRALSEADVVATVDGCGATALFAALPSQSHTLGLTLAAEAFRRDGWAVKLLLNTSTDEIVDYAKTRRPDVIGLTAGRHERLQDITELAGRLKGLPSCGPILLGGHAAGAFSTSGPKAPVDAVVTDIEGALRFAQRRLAGAVS